MIRVKKPKRIKPPKRRRSRDQMIKIKTPEQIEGIRESCKLASKTLQHLKQFIQVGAATEFIDQQAEMFIRDHGAIPAPLGYKGASSTPFPKSVCISLNEVICHGIPSTTTLSAGDIVNIDVTTILNGYYGDTSQMFVMPDAGVEANRLVTVAFEALWVGIRQVRPGNHIGNIGYEIARYIEPTGYSVVRRFCGHGVGLAFHEPPAVMHVAPQNTGAIMQPGMIFTIEPMINSGTSNCLILEDDWTVVTADQGLSAQYEHTVLVTRDGCEILTQLPEEEDKNA